MQDRSTIQRTRLWRIQGHTRNRLGGSSDRTNINDMRKLGYLFLKTNFRTLLHDPQLRIVEHDLLLSVVLKLNGCNGIVCRAFHADNFSESELLMFYFLSNL